MKKRPPFQTTVAFSFCPPLWAWGCERVPTLSRSPVGLGFAAPASFVSSHELAAGDARGFRPSRALPWGYDSRLLLLLFLRTDSPPRMRAGSDPLALSHGDCDSRLLLLLFLRTDSQPGDARGFRPSRALPRGLRFAAPTSFVSSHELAAGDARGSVPLALSRGGRDSRLSTSFASPFVSPYSSSMRTVSDWGGTVTAVDSFLGCAESRFAERKSVWVTASGSVTRISRSAERLYTR